MTRHTRASNSQVDSSDVGDASTRTVKTRRAHRKSRNGCTECKRRHIRCDERQPSCTNCEVAERMCVFPPPKVGKQTQKQGQPRLAKQQQGPKVTAAPSPGSEVSSPSNANNINAADSEHAQMPTPAPYQPNNPSDFGQTPGQSSHRLLLRHDALPPINGLDANPQQIPSPALPTQLGDVYSPSADCLPGLSLAPDVVSKAVFTPQHIILLHHADSVPNMTGPNRNAVDIAIRRAVDSPYLIDEILAFTAFHLAHLYPGSAAYLRHLATELQTRALASFTHLTAAAPNDDKATAVPRFLFSSILGRHVLADALAHYLSDFNIFIDRFVECINLNRGIRSVTPPARVYLCNSEIQPFLNVVLEAQNQITSPGPECDPLIRLMDKSDLSESSATACRQAIELLQWSFDICRGLDEENYPASASVFSVKIEAGFVDVLRKRQPEALVILAYYGILLHRCRGFWAFGNTGGPMVRAIAVNLGSYWQEALAWPLHMLETEPNTDVVSAAPRPDVLTTSFRTPA